MLPVANFHLRDLYETTVEFFALRSPRAHPPDIDSDTDDHDDLPLTPRDQSPVHRPHKDRPDLRVELEGPRRSHCPRACSCRSIGASAAAYTLYSMRREHDTAKSDLQRSQVELARLEERCRQLERTLKDTKELLRAREIEVDAFRKDKEKLIAERFSRERPPSATLDRRRSHDVVRHRSNSSQSRLSQQVRPSTDWSDLEESTPLAAHRRTDTPTDNVSTLSEEERAQAKSMETFLTKADLWSGAQVIQAVQDLNSEILQFAASAVELCVFAKQRPINRPEGDVASRLGKSLTRTLVNRDHSQDPMLVQIALQGCITYCISRALSSFCIGYQSKANHTLTQLYTNMFHFEPQPTSSRWRALAHKHIHRIHSDLDDYTVREMTQTIHRWSIDLFLICGSTSPSHDAFRKRFETQVTCISKSACRIARIIREEIMSTNFEVVGVDSGRTFDAQQMTDAFENCGTSEGTVLCTTELGLRCSTQKGTMEPSGSSQENIERRLLLRPKVILESAIPMLDQR